MNRKIRLALFASLLAAGCGTTGENPLPPDMAAFWDALAPAV